MLARTLWTHVLRHVTHRALHPLTPPPCPSPLPHPTTVLHSLSQPLLHPVMCPHHPITLSIMPSITLLYPLPYLLVPCHPLLYPITLPHPLPSIHTERGIFPEPGSTGLQTVDSSHSRVGPASNCAGTASTPCLVAQRQTVETEPPAKALLAVLGPGTGARQTPKAALTSGVSGKWQGWHGGQQVGAHVSCMRGTGRGKVTDLLQEAVVMA